MNISAINSGVAAQLNTAREASGQMVDPQAALEAAGQGKPEASAELRGAFDQFVGETFYSQMLKSMRSSVGKAPYFHGGQAEEVFQGQLDQTLAEEMTKASASQFTGPMFELFNLNRQ